MHIAIIAGSHRTGSQSRKVADYIAAHSVALSPTHSTDIIDLAGNPLPLWDGEGTKPDSASGKVWKGFSERLRRADALVVISPEWHGMVPAGLKNFFLYAHAKDVGHKPALIITVSSGRGGAYPVAELRMSTSKNNRMLYIPEHIIIQNAEKNLNGPTETSSEDGFIRRRISFALRQLMAYGAALAEVRASGVTENAEFPNGM